MGKQIKGEREEEKREREREVGEGRERVYKVREGAE